MTTIYVPRLIESAEQAEALPEGTFANVSWDQPRVKIGPNEWADSVEDFDDAEMIGAEALVPIEAEEEFQDIDAYEASGHMRRHHLTRYTTPWENAS